MHNDSLVGWNWHNKDAEIHGTVEGEFINYFGSKNVSRLTLFSSTKSRAILSYFLGVADFFSFLVEISTPCGTDSH